MEKAGPTPYSAYPLLWLRDITRSPGLKFRTFGPTAIWLLVRVSSECTCYIEHVRNI